MPSVEPAANVLLFAGQIKLMTFGFDTPFASRRLQLKGLVRRGLWSAQQPVDVQLVTWHDVVHISDSVLRGNMVTTTQAWELVHEQHTPVKQAARRLGVRVCELYELLEKEKADRDSATHRAVALLSAVITPRIARTAQDGGARARADQLLDEGLATRVICERLGRTDRWLASVRQAREVACTAIGERDEHVE
jgi:hypothetical protein